MNKPKILLAAEFTGLSTGYGNYGRELLSRLFNTDKYEIAEYSSYVYSDAPETEICPWKVFGAEPHPKDENGQRAYSAYPINQFGRLYFEQTLLEYKPDVIIGFRDPWTEAHVADSPFRKYYKWIYQPTVDSAPQSRDWLSMFASADSVLTYTDWGGKVLREESGGRINPVGWASPIPDDIFTPADKKSSKALFGLDPNSIIVGSAMRSQPRKLIPDLIEAFSIFVNNATPSIASRAKLWLHTTYPDVSWNSLPDYLNHYGVLSKVFFTYLCHTCGLAYPSYFQSARTSCPRCANIAMFPTTRYGVLREQLRDIYRAWDFSVQYSVAEGQGMPVMEAAACGIPCAAVDYSAMSDVIRNIGGEPVKVQRMFWDHGTSAQRALPDNDYLAGILLKHFCLPFHMRSKIGFETRCEFEKNYNWNNTLSVWENAIASVGGPEKRWDEPIKKFTQPDFSYNGPDDGEFLRRGFKFGIQREELVGSYLYNQLARDLAWGCKHPTNDPHRTEESIHNDDIKKFGRNEAIEEMKSIRTFSEYWENQRCSN